MNKEVGLFAARAISKRFPGVQALDKVDFDLRPGEVHAILGENGAGKSTFIKICAGAYQPDAGELLLRGKNVVLPSPQAALSLGISTIYQELSLEPYLSVGENLFVGRWPRTAFGTVDWSRLHQQAQRILDEMGVDIRSRDIVRSLSTAECQMVEIARAVSFRASIIIMDEPTSSISPREVDILFKLIEDLKAKGTAFIYITHKLDEVFRIADRVTVLRDGRCIAGVRGISELTQSELIRMMIGRELTDMYVKEQVAIGEVVLKVSGLTTPGVFDDISFELRRGEILAIFGLVGAGRTEVVEALFGAQPAASGRIWIDAKEISINKPEEAIKAGLGLVPDDRKGKGLILMMSLCANVGLASLSSNSHMGILDHGRERTKAANMVKAMDIAASDLEASVAGLSGGTQQKVVLAKWMGTHSKVLIMDEPTRGIDVGAKEEIYRLMSRFVSNGGAILMVSSELPEVLGVADRILVMREGRLTATLSRGNASQETIMHYAVRTGDDDDAN